MSQSFTPRPFPERAIRLVGLTGSIASGKSSAAAAFAAQGVAVVDADRLAREVVEPGTPGLGAIHARFGDGVLAPGGSLDRRALGALVFRDEAARRDLEAILHPRIAEAAKEALERALAETLAREPDGFVLYEVPLLFEGKMEARFDLVAAVWADPDAQRARLAARDELPPWEIEGRIASQLSGEEKARRADRVLDNSGTPDRLREEVEVLTRRIFAHNRQIRRKSEND